MNPRPYQNEFISKVELGWKEFHKQLGVAPTGSGKTIIFSHLAKRRLDQRSHKTLILAHREELIDQAIAKLHAATGIFADKEKAESRASFSAPVVVGSVQTMMRRFDRWPQEHFGLVVVDEAHHTIADSYLKVLRHFDSHADVLGVTATPDRGDKKNLGQYYENVAHEIRLIDLIKDGFLCPITIRALPIQIDLNSVSSIAGDFDSGELGHILEPYLAQIAHSIKAHIGDRKTLCFLPLIGTSLKFVQHCRDVGLSVEHIDGQSEDRKEKLAAFTRGDFQVLSNAMLLTEGYDEPSISCVIVLRPTRSRPLFAQMVGRGTRIAPNKTDLLLLDFLWLHERHSIVRPASLIAGSEEEADAITALAEEQGELGEDLDLLEGLSDVQSQREEALRKKLAALADRQAKFISAEEFALKHHSLAIAEFEPTMGWHTRELTEKQVEWIAKAGVDPQSVRGRGQASQILDVYFKAKNEEPASDKQRWVMKKHGWRSQDNQRGPFQATRGDAIAFFAKLNEAK